MRFLKLSVGAVGLLWSVVGCGIQVTTQTTKTITVPTTTEVPSRHYSIQSVMWQQNAAEYRALCYQAFNTAQFRLDELLQDESLKGKKLAIITDIDETVMDNSPYNASLILEDREYTSATWNDWVNKAEALPVPGATDFLKYAESRGVEVFYISNRVEKEVEPTIQNMKAIHFPFADKEHLFFKGESGEKETRFNKVKEEYEVLLYMGDNLSDFSNMFMTPSTEGRRILSDQLRGDFGKRFIVLPNPMYGDWEMKGIYQGKYDWNNAQKDSIQKGSLRGY